MADTAAHLVASVLPEVPVRHWVCSFPWGVRAVLGYDRQLCRAATRAFAQEVSRSLTRCAKQELGLDSVSDALTGLVAVVQRTDGALRLNVHLHCLGLDGVYVRDPPESGRRFCAPNVRAGKSVTTRLRSEGTGRTSAFSEGVVSQATRLRLADWVSLPRLWLEHAPRHRCTAFERWCDWRRQLGGHARRRGRRRKRARR